MENQKNESLKGMGVTVSEAPTTRFHLQDAPTGVNSANTLAHFWYMRAEHDIDKSNMRLEQIEIECSKPRVAGGKSNGKYVVTIPVAVYKSGGKGPEAGDESEEKRAQLFNMPLQKQLKR